MSDTFCPLLFNHLATHPSGEITPCCLAYSGQSVDYDDNGNVKKKYNIQEDSISASYNSDIFKQNRIQSLSGQWPRDCGKCKRDEENGLRSRRIHEIESYPAMTVDKARSLIRDDGYMDNVQFDYIELRLGNICNAKCVTCNPWSSSQWVNDWNLLKTSLDFNIGEFNASRHVMRWPENERVWEDLSNHVDNLRQIHINGGEPTLSKQHLSLLETLINKNLTHVRLQYHVNGTMFPEQVTNLLDEFNSVRLTFSIDDLKDRNYYIRYPTNWYDVMSNIESAVYDHMYEVDIGQTISILNFWNIGLFYKFFDNKFNGKVHVHHNPIQFPSYLAPGILPYEFRIKALNNIRQDLDSDTLYNELVNQFGHDTGSDPIKLHQGFKFITELDRIRGTNWMNIFLELTEITNA